VGVESRDRICPLDYFHEIITIPIKDTLSLSYAPRSESNLNSVVAFGPDYIRILRYQDFTPI
jgi:hypothetical protein